MGRMGSDYKRDKAGHIVARFPDGPAPVSPRVRAQYLLDKRAARQTPEWQAHVARKYKLAQKFRTKSLRRGG